MDSSATSRRQLENGTNNCEESSNEEEEEIILSRKLPTECTKCQATKEEKEISLKELKSQMESEIFKLRQDVEKATKAKELIVMRYATSERDVIRQKRDLENSEKQIKNLTKEIEILNKKNKTLASEKERLSCMVDAKIHEAHAALKEVEQLNLNLSAKDISLKLAQTKLEEEIASHTETKGKLENLLASLEAQKDEDIAENPNTLCNGKSNASNNNDENPTDSESQCDFKTNENEEDCNKSHSVVLQKELDLMKQKNNQLIEENNQLVVKVQSLEEERVVLERKLLRLQESNSENLHQIASLQSDLAATESFKVQLQNEKDLVSSLQAECQQLRQSHSDVLADMAVCRNKEAELLAYTQQVTEKNVQLQSEFSSVEAKSFVMEEENERLRLQYEQLQNELKTLEKSLAQENKNFCQEKQSLEQQIEAQRGEIVFLQNQLDEAQGEIALLNRKLNTSVKELSKELLSVRRQVKEGTNSETISQSSRTSSSNSLNTMETPSSAPKKVEKEKESDISIPTIPDQQVLIEKIVKLQRTLAKKQEKIEFLKEHVNQLVDSLQKKTKIIQNYAMSQDVDSLASDMSEQNKAQVMKHGGIMASIYGSKQADDGLTLELSLEMNRTMQRLLEDSLLKNIMLKENINTLGKEISRLTEQLNKNSAEKSV